MRYSTLTATPSMNIARRNLVCGGLRESLDNDPTRTSVSTS